MGHELAERALALAERAKAPAMLAGAHFQLGVSLMATGQFEGARTHFERAVALYGAGPSRNLDAYFRQNTPQLLGVAMIFLGYPLTALSRSHDLLTAARRRSDPHSIAIALFSSSMHRLLLRDSWMMAERADEMLSIAAEHKIPISAIQGTFFRGWAMVAAGRSEEGFAQMYQSISDPMVSEGISTALMLAALADAWPRLLRSVQVYRAANGSRETTS